MVSPPFFFYTSCSPIPWTGVPDATGLVVSVSVTIKTLGYDTTMVSSHLCPQGTILASCVYFIIPLLFFFVHLPRNHVKGCAGMTSHGNKVIVRVRRLGGID